MCSLSAEHKNKELLRDVEISIKRIVGQGSGAGSNEVPDIAVVSLMMCRIPFEYFSSDDTIVKAVADRLMLWMNKRCT